MESAEISKGRLDDAHNILQMFVNITDALLEHGVDQWNYDYPDLETIKNDISNASNFVIRSGGDIAASIVLDQKQDDQYKDIGWKYKSDAVLVIHRLGVNPKFQGRGLGKKMCAFAEDFARQNNLDCIRLDAFSENPISTNMYLKLGYRQAEGLCYFRGKATPFYCYEKKII